MRLTQSIKFRLAASLWILFAVIAGVGLFGLGRLDDFNRQSSDIRERWLKNTRYLGDLNNFTSDFRAAEGAFLIVPSDVDVAAVRREMASLDEAVEVARQGYEGIIHEQFETAGYRVFVEKWEKYRAEAKRTLDTMESGNKAEAINLFMSASRIAFAAATDALTELSERNNAQARVASDHADQVILEARLLIGAAIALGVSMAVAILLHVTRQITNPLLELADCMRQLAQNETGIKIRSIDRVDELGEMARSVAVFRDNAIELRVSRVALASEACMLEEKLAHERRLGESQREFVSMVSHEFRTPMTIIDGHAQRLVNTHKTDEGIVERATKIRAAINRMDVMIERLLQSVRLMEAPSLYFHPNEFDVRALLEEVCRLHREVSSTVALVESFDADVQVIYGDRGLLFQAFSNLVSNAIKYSRSGGCVSVFARRKRGALKIFVEDRGIGIPRKDMDKLFYRYFRGSNVSSVTGSGIGLSLVKIIVKLHGGTIRVKSREGQGSIFLVSLPL